MVDLLIEEMAKSAEWSTSEKKRIEKIKFPEYRDTRKFKARKNKVKKVYGF